MASGASSFGPMRATAGAERMTGRRRVVRIEREGREAEERAVERGCTTTRPALAVLLQLDEGRDEEIAPREDARAAADDVHAVLRDVPREAEARLDVVRVAAARRRLQLRLDEVRVVAVRVEVVPDTEGDGHVRGAGASRPGRTRRSGSCSPSRRSSRRRRGRRTGAPSCRSGQRKRPGGIGVDDGPVDDALPRGSGLQRVCACHPVEGVAQFPLVALPDQVAVGCSRRSGACCRACTSRSWRASSAAPRRSALPYWPRSSLVAVAESVAVRLNVAL